jgi:membrane-associated protease RseP (regulator of RpoE activity)
MLEKKLSCVVAFAALFLAEQCAAQPASAQERAEREAAASEEAQSAKEFAAAEREFAREVSRTRALTAAESANVQRELSRARNELARTVADVARIQAQVREPALQDVQRNWRFMAAGQPVLGLNIEDTDFGVFVRGVTPNGPAAAAGVEVNDTIVSINDVELSRGSAGRSPSATLLGQIGNVVPGDDVKLRILRGGDYRDVVVTAGDNRFRMPYFVSVAPGKRPLYAGPAESWMSFGQSGAWSDIELVTLTPALGEYFGTNEGLLVVRAGRAGELGFRDGDVIIDLAGRKPQSPEHALRILASFEPGETLQAAIMRQKRRESLPIRVSAPSE